MRLKDLFGDEIKKNLEHKHIEEAYKFGTQLIILEKSKKILVNFCKSAIFHSYAPGQMN